MTIALTQESPHRDPMDLSIVGESPPGPSKIHVLLLISSLEYGGAERQVIELANQLEAHVFETTVCSLSEHVPLATELRDAAHRLEIVPRRGRFDFGVVRRLARLMRRRRIQVVHTFLFDAEIVGRLAAKLARVPVVIASERNADYKRPFLHTLALRLTQSCFDVMIANSLAGKRFNVRTLGLDPARIRVIRNGVDVVRFRPGHGLAVRKQLGIPMSAPVVGMVAAFKRQKRHGDFFQMAQRVLRRFPDAWFVCVGEPLRANLQGAEDYHREMRERVGSLGIAHRCVFAGHRADMPAVYRMLDVTVLTSSREGTPNVLLESMACGVPIVATNVADNEHLVPGGDVGSIVGVGEVEEMADRVCRLLADSHLRRQRGRAARQWVLHRFSTAAMARKAGAVYREVLHRKARTA